MTPTARLSAAMDTIGWGPQTLAERWNVNERTVRRWLAGQNDPPEPLLSWLERAAAWVRDNPPPGR